MPESRVATLWSAEECSDAMVVGEDMSSSGSGSEEVNRSVRKT